MNLKKKFVKFEKRQFNSHSLFEQLEEQWGKFEASQTLNTKL